MLLFGKSNEMFNTRLALLNNAHYVNIANRHRRTMQRGQGATADCPNGLLFSLCWNWCYSEVVNIFIKQIFSNTIKVYRQFRPGFKQYTKEC